jgi:hypothetical protein
VFNKKLFKDIKDRQVLRRKDNELKMQQMNEMKQHIVKLEEELAAARASGGKTS